jgi:hypothetical protein
LVPGINVEKLFYSSSLTKKRNKLDRLYLTKPFEAVLMFTGKANYPRGEHLKGTILGVGYNFTRIY